MNGIKIKDIKGMIVDNTGYWGDDYRRGFNDALSKQGKVEIELNREKLAKNIHTYIYPVGLFDNNVDKKGHSASAFCLRLADSIIDDLPELIEVKK